MENPFTSLQPEKLWQYFYEICQIPHCSKKEEKIVAYLIEFGKRLDLETINDEVGNVVIRKPATPGYENKPSIALQSHVDMVCEKNADLEFDFNKDAIQPCIDGEWVKAKGTTLGADDGIGVATQMALLTSTDINHGPIECLFTVDEETGLTGAFALKSNMLKSKILLNLDSEDEGEIFMGCAGGKDTVGRLAYQTEAVPAGMKAIQIKVSGLMGGHSGDDIEKKRGNANKILVRFLWEMDKKYGIRLSSIDGGNLRNAIAREAEAILLIADEKAQALLADATEMNTFVQAEFKISDKGVKLEAKEIATPANVVDETSAKKLIATAYAMPHGVVAMSQDIEGFVETSTNLASIKMENGQLLINTSQRSSIESAKDNICGMVASVFDLGGFKYESGGGYPGWTPDPNSAILKVSVEQFKKQFKYDPIVRAVHAGLECGLFSEKFPGLDMVSIGPTIRGPHSPDERLEIATVERFWKFVLDILEAV